MILRLQGSSRATECAGDILAGAASGLMHVQNAAAPAPEIGSIYEIATIGRLSGMS